jgi:hypothetical protein
MGNLKRNYSLMSEELLQMSESWQKNGSGLDRSSLHKHFSYMKESAQASWGYYNKHIWQHMVSIALTVMNNVE